MNSRIFTGQVMHARLTPVRHEFRYPFYCYVFDLDELTELSRNLFLFGYNRLAVVALHDADYLRPGPSSIREKLNALLAENHQATPARVELITNARYLNYVFNPVSFYYCYAADGSLQTVVTEINNTFGDKHVYIFSDPLSPRPGFVARYEVKKDFHVSPFYDMQGEYEASFSPIGDKLDIHFNILRGGKTDFVSRQWGRCQPLTNASQLLTLLRYPLTAALTMPRILWQAARLHYQKKVRVYTRPAPESTMTIREAQPTARERFCKSVLSYFLRRLDTGLLRMHLPHGEPLEFGNADNGPTVEIKVRKYDFFPKVLFRGDIGLGEAFQDGDWEAESVTAVIQYFIDNWHVFDDRDVWLSKFGRLLNFLRHRRRANTLEGSKDNIGAHYDLGNDLFKRLLDPTMMYSSAVFENPSETLEQAQRRKLQMILDKARIRPGQHVLEIGTGWGTFAIEAARQTGCRVTTLTLSREQKAMAEARIAEAGLSEKIEVKLCDYRHVEGSYDRVVSIEMLEAVGYEFFGAYFASIERVLKPNGIVVLQVITFPDQRFEAAKRGVDWIQKHIFPGSLLPSISALAEAARDHSGLVIEHLENIGPHYAKTLAIWRENLFAHRAELAKLGYDDFFIRTFDYYFSYCEAGFERRVINDLQLVLSRPANPELS